MTDLKREPLTVAILIGFQYGEKNTNSINNEKEKSSPLCTLSNSIPGAYPDYHNTELKWWRERLNIYDELPGVLIDLYLAYQFCMKSNPHKIIVITDVEKDPNWQDVLDAFGMQLVGSRVLHFVSECKDNGFYRRYRDKEWLISEVKKCSQDTDRLIFYYSGHCTNGNLELPTNLSHDRAKACEMDISIIKPPPPSKNDSVDMTEFSILIINNTTLEAQALFIFDCCYCTDLGLPFKLSENNIFRLCPDNDFFTKRNVLSLSSTTPHQKSISTINGSFFTRHFFSAMRNGVRNLLHIKNMIIQYGNDIVRDVKVPPQQTMSIYSSHPHTEKIWSWLFSPHIPYGIEVDETLGAIILTIQ